MDRELKRWELALLFGLLVALAAGSWLSREQADLADQVIRFHVIANSDSAADQELKLAVRDRVLEQARAIYPERATLEEARKALEDNLTVLAAAGQAVTEEWGAECSVTASLEECWFPTKQYGELALPAGEYTALRVVIGAGEGANWWCVAFPPLCLGAAEATAEAAAWFTPEQTALITGADGYVLKFKGMELLGQLRGLFS